RTIDATTALQIGLVEHVLPDEEMLSGALDIAAQIAAHPATAVGATKRCVNLGLREGFEAGLAEERRQRVETGRGPDAREGRNAFLEKREPRFNQGKESGSGEY
nr:enoyl-CoA hydratase [Anaerolineae bacterium]